MTSLDLLLLGLTWGIYAGVFGAITRSNMHAEKFEWRGRICTERNPFCG